MAIAHLVTYLFGEALSNDYFQNAPLGLFVGRQEWHSATFYEMEEHVAMNIFP